MGQFIAFAHESNARRLTSDDGLNWTIGVATTLNNPVLLVQHPTSGRMVCAHGTGQVSYSDDNGVTWTSTGETIGQAPVPQYGARAWIQNDKFYLCAGGNVGARIHKSVDGETWAQSPPYSPVFVFGPGPANEQFGAAYSQNQYSFSYDEFATKGGNQSVPNFSGIRRMQYLENPAGYLFIGFGTRSWQYQNPVSFGVLPNWNNGYIPDIKWSETLQRVLVSTYNQNRLYIGQIGLQFVETATDRPCNTAAEGNGIVVFGSDTSGFVAIQSLVSGPQSVDPIPGTPVRALIYAASEAPDISAEFSAPLAGFSTRFEIIEELQAEFMAPLASYEAIISSTINMEAEFLAPLPNMEFVLEGNEFESLFHTALPPMPEFSANLGLPSDLYGRFFAPLPKFSAELYLPQDFSAEFAAPLPDFYSVHEVKQSMFGEFAVPMALFEAYIEDHASATIAVGFGKLQLQIITEEERNSALTFVAVT